VADLCRKYNIGTARFHYWKDQLTNSAHEIFESRGKKRDQNQITAEKDLEISRLKDVVAEITFENPEIKKKDWRTLAEEGKDTYIRLTRESKGGHIADSRSRAFASACSGT
jgi:transposase-like protein